MLKMWTYLGSNKWIFVVSMMYFVVKCRLFVFNMYLLFMF